MNYRTRYRPTFPPIAVASTSVAALVATQWGPLGAIIERDAPSLSRMVVAVAIVLPLAALLWYLFSWARLDRGSLTVRSTISAHRVDLRTLVRAEVFARRGAGSAARRTPRPGAQPRELLLRLEDEDGGQVVLPLGTWRHEELLMAVVLRATVDRRVRITGDPELVRRFSGVLDTYKSWERRQAAAA